MSKLEILETVNYLNYKTDLYILKCIFGQASHLIIVSAQNVISL